MSQKETNYVHFPNIYLLPLIRKILETCSSSVAGFLTVWHFQNKLQEIQQCFFKQDLDDVLIYCGPDWIWLFCEIHHSVAVSLKFRKSAKFMSLVMTIVDDRQWTSQYCV